MSLSSQRLKEISLVTKRLNDNKRVAMINIEPTNGPMSVSVSPAQISQEANDELKPVYLRETIETFARELKKG